MLRDQIIPLVETTIIFPLLTDAVSVVAAAYATAVARGPANRRRDLQAAVAGRTNAVLSAMWPSTGR
jgi:hypothetical protein